MYKMSDTEVIPMPTGKRVPARKPRGKRVQAAVAAEQITVPQSDIDHRDATIAHLTQQLNDLKPLAERQRKADQEKADREAARKEKKRAQGKAYRERKKREMEELLADTRRRK